MRHAFALVVILCLAAPAAAKPAAKAPKPRAVQVGKAYNEDLGAGLTLSMAWIPAGSFRMGSRVQPERTAQRYGGHWKYYTDELPMHTVRLDAFWIGKFEVTNAQFRRFRASHSSKWYKKSHLDKDNMPAIAVSWHDARAFCEWLSGETGRSYQLPTEAQWEHACRARTSFPRYWGDGDAQMGRYANTADRAAKRVYEKEWSPNLRSRNTDFAKTLDGFAAAAPVGSLKPNAFGLHDTIGNAREWCHDWYGADYYGKSPGRDPRGPASGRERVVRGGSWMSSPASCRSAFRAGVLPGTKDVLTGFRVVCVPATRKATPARR